MTPEDQVKQQTIQTVGPVGSTVREQDKIMLVLSYFGLLALIPLLTVKDSEYVKWHAKQGLAVFAVSFGIGIASMILAFIPFIHFLTSIAACVAQVGLFVLDIMAMVKALNGERYRIPLVADVADKF